MIFFSRKVWLTAEIFCLIEAGHDGPDADCDDHDA
jgi:hypothetical protein